MSAPVITYTGPLPLTIHPGDRFEIAVSDATDAAILVRRDWDGTAAGLTFDPGDHATLVFHMAGRKRAGIEPAYRDHRLRPFRVIRDRLRRARR